MSEDKNEAKEIEIKFKEGDFTYEGNKFIPRKKLYKDTLKEFAAGVTYAQAEALSKFDSRFTAAVTEYLGEQGIDKMTEDDELASVEVTVPMTARQKLTVKFKREEEIYSRAKGKKVKYHGTTSFNMSNSFGSFRSGAVGTKRNHLKALATKAFGEEE